MKTYAVVVKVEGYVTIEVKAKTKMKSYEKFEELLENAGEVKLPDATLTNIPGAELFTLDIVPIPLSPKDIQLVKTLIRGNIMNKFELTTESRKYHGLIYWRIKALKNFGNVKKGDLGGFVQQPNNLSHLGNCWIEADAMVGEWCCVHNNYLVGGNTKLTGRIHLFGNGTIEGNFEISGKGEIMGNIEILTEG